MGTAALTALAVLASTPTLSVSSRDGSVRALAPAGYAVAAVATGREADIELRDAAGNALSVRELKGAGLELEAAAYDELKALEVGLGGECLPQPMRDHDLGGGRTARGVEGVCGAREYGVLISTDGGGARLVIASGRIAPARELLASVAAAGLPSGFRVLTAGSLPPLAPLPPRPFHGKPVLYALAFFALLQGGALAVRALPKKNTDEAPPPPPGPFPISIERRHLRSELVFDIRTADGACYEAFSDRKAAGVMTLGGALLVVFGLQAAAGAGARALLETLAFSGLAYAFGGLLQRSEPRNLRVVDGEDRRQFEVREESFSPLNPAGAAFDGEGWELFRLRRKRQGRRRTWELIEPLKQQVFMELVEKPSFKNWLRPLVGHMGGHLRTEYALVFRGQEVGALRRMASVGNKLLLEMSPIEGLDYRIVLAAALFIERVDPDRWHPWPV